MNLYNQNFRWFLISNMIGVGATHESKPFLCLNYNQGIDVNTEPSFTEFSYTTADFITLDKIKIVKKVESGGDVINRGRHYSFVSNVSNYDTFDEIIASVNGTEEVMYFLYIETTIDLTTYSKDKFNQTSLIVVKNKDATPFKYDDFSATQYEMLPLDSTYETIPLSLDYMDELDKTVQSGNYYKHQLVI